MGQGPANAQLSAAEAVSRRQLRTRGRRLRNCRNAFLSHWARKGASGCATVGGGGSFQTTVAGARAAIAQLSQKAAPLGDSCAFVSGGLGLPGCGLKFWKKICDQLLLWLLLKKWSKIEFFCPAKGVSLWEVQF